MSTPRLRTPRLLLIAGDLEHSLAELEDRAELARLLDAAVPPDWPPPLNDEESLRWFVRRHRETPGATGWLGWYFVLPGEGGGGPGADADAAGARLIGAGGFKGPPSPDGTVEVGYSIMAEFQGRGYGTEGIRALVRRAFEDPRVNRVIAETFPHMTPSILLLERIGFRREGEALEPGALRFEIAREAFRPD